MIAAGLALLLLPPVETFPAPIGPAATGRLQCYRPDRAKRTCQSIARYRRDGKGGFLNDAELPIAENPTVTMESTAPVEIRDGAVCGRITLDSLEKALFLSNGVPLSSEAAQPFRVAVLRQMMPVLDREICTRYSAKGDHLVANATIDGKAGLVPAVDVIWVDFVEGYRVVR